MRHPPNRLQQFGKRGLKPAEASRKQQAQQVGLLEIADRRRGEPAQPLGLHGAIGQPRNEFVADAVQGTTVDHGHALDPNILFSM